MDWQLRELCKLMRESDIHARLGRLPKGLAGVYDEITTSIKSQPDCNSNLAIRALKWMLVAERPLNPSELAAAAELNPSMSVDSSAPTQEPTLEVELLIQSCEGLLLLDTTWYPHVVRFSHLSVQEYLETRNDVWDIGVVDAQLFVSEACLWTLQYGHVPSSRLYEYAAKNWYKHCRSYQDLALSGANSEATRHELCIPLLDSFLGSPAKASNAYIKWAGWATGDILRHFLLYPLFSTPLYPTFCAAFAGLGELVGWLWDSDENEMKVKNDGGDSLLAVASKHGTAWIVTKMLKRGFKINDVQNALYHAGEGGNSSIIKLLLDQGADVNGCLPGYFNGTALGAAAYGGDLESMKLLLDRGADVNLTGGYHGTALGAAAYCGHLKIVKLLLDRGADANLPAGGYVTTLSAAACGRNLDIVKLLLDRGADANLTGGNYGTALGAAAYIGELEIVKLLLDRGADANLTGGMYGTALGAATYSGELDIVTLLLGRGADVNLTCGDYGTALGAAAFSGKLDIVKLLLGRGADVNLTGGGYGTALVASFFFVNQYSYLYYGI